MIELLDRYLRRVTRVNGMEVAKSSLRNPMTGRVFANTWDAYDPETGEVIATVTSSRTKTAADMLIEAVYRHNCRIVYERQGGKCGACESRFGLQTHHRVHRSKGRDDRIPNLIVLCRNCHHKKHN